MTTDELQAAATDAVRALDHFAAEAERADALQSAHYARARADRLRTALARVGVEVTDEPPQADEVDAPC